MDLWSLWICRACGSMEPMDLQSLWIHGACGSVEPLDLQSLWIRRACGSMEPEDPWSLWICGACGSMEPVDLQSLVDPQSPGSPEYAFQKCKQMTSYLMFDVYRFSNMILANEHRSLGPIFIRPDQSFYVLHIFGLSQPSTYSLVHIQNKSRTLIGQA